MASRKSRKTTEKRKTSRDTAQAVTREALMAAAEKLVAERGFGGMSVGDIAGTAGFTKGAFYSNFEDRSAMVLALLRRLKERQRETLAGLEHAGTEPGAALDLVAMYTAHHAADPVSSVLVAEVQLQARRDPMFAKELRETFQEQVRVIAAWIDRIAKRAGVHLPMASADIARSFLALSQGLAQQPADRGEIGRIVRGVLSRLFGI